MTTEKYPLLPKSNKKLQAGQFWPIKLSNHYYACGVILDVPPKDGRDTKGIFIGLLNWTGKSKPTRENLESISLKIIRQGSALQEQEITNFQGTPMEVNFTEPSLWTLIRAFRFSVLPM